MKDIKGLKKTPVKAYITFLALILFLIIILSTGLGYISITPIEVLKIIIAKITGNPDLTYGIDTIKSYIVMDVRLPRIICALIVGSGLSAAGVIFQGLLLNPLADPYTLGLSSGAAFGAALAILLNINPLGIYSLPLFALTGAIATLFTVIYLSSSQGQYSSTNLILSGIIISTILSAGLGFLQYLSHENVSIIIFWLMGSFASKTWPEALLLTTIFLAGTIITAFYANDLNIISLGDRSAHSLGVNIKRVRLILLTTASLITAACVSVSGIIGFVGLIIPHLMRAIIGPDNRKLIITSAISGAILLLLADTITRALLTTELPVGIITALIGGPFFCYIFRQQQLGRRNE